MASFSHSSGYDLHPWQPNSLNGEKNLFPSSPPSESYSSESYAANGSYSKSFEETFKSKLTVTSDIKHAHKSEDGEVKLNTSLASITDKLKYLEKQREILEDRWSMLQVEDDSPKDLEPIYLSYIDRLLGQVNSVNKKNHHTLRSFLDMMDSVNDRKDKYEDELHVRTDLEHAFVQLKKDVDTCSLDRTELEVKQQEMKGIIELMKSIYEEELKEVMEESGDISVLVNMEHGCPLNLDSVVQEVKERYESIAARSREEAQAMSRKKLQQGVLQAGRCEEELENSRSQITQLNSKIQRMRSEVLSIQNQGTHLGQQVALAKTNSIVSLQDANAKLAEVQDALQKAKQEVAWQLREYQDMMNIKIALDIEIVTYKKLLEGEESRLHSPPVVNVHCETEVRRPNYQRASRSQNGSSSWRLHSNMSDN